MIELTQTQTEILKDVVERHMYQLEHDIEYWTDSLRTMHKDNIQGTIEAIDTMKMKLNELENIKL